MSFDNIDDIYTPIQNFLVSYLELDNDKVIINSQNAPLPILPFVAIYIDALDIWNEYDDYSTEDGTLIQETLQSIPVIIDFYGNLSGKVIKLQKGLNLETTRQLLNENGLTILDIGTIRNITNSEQENEYIEHYQMRTTFQIVSSIEDTTVGTIDEVGLEFEIETGVSDIITDVITLDNIVTINK